MATNNNLPMTSSDRWQTSQILLDGGLISNIDEITLARSKAGALCSAINFECSLEGGYRKVSGFAPYDPAAVPGTGPVLGVTTFVKGGIVAARNGNIYTSIGSGWTKINSDTRTAPPKAHFWHYNFGSEKIVIADGVNRPATWDGTTYTVLSNAPLGATCVHDFKNYLFFGQGSVLTFSAPGSDTDYNPVDGAGQIQMGFTIVAIHSWRDVLYVFGQDRISSISGTVFGGSTPNAVVSETTNQLGCIAPDSIVEISGDLLYLAPDGIRTISGTTRIGDVELGAITEPVHNLFLNFINTYATATGYNFSACVVRNKNQYRLFAVNTGGNPSLAQGWTVCIRNTSPSYFGNLNNWEFFQLQGINANCCNSGYIAGTEYVIHGGFDGYVYRQEQGITFNGAAIAASMRLPYNGFDDPQLRKTFYKLTIDFFAEGPSRIYTQLQFDFGNNLVAQPGSMTISEGSNSFAIYGTAIYGTDIYGESPTPYGSINVIGSGKNMAINFSTNDTVSYPYTIRSVILDYQVNGRR